MQHFKTISDYCKAIQIPAPKQAYFDIRTFEENMPTVVAKMPSFKHEFYAIAIKVEGGGKAISGHYTNFPEGATVFFNTPFQLISWDIISNWEGYYLMFSKEFITKSKHLQDLLREFPFLKIDKAMPFEVKPEEVSVLLSMFEFIYQENQELKKDSNLIIEAHLLVLLNYIKRFFDKQVSKEEAEKAIRNADVNLLSRFQTLIETSFYESTLANKRTHSPSFYAEQLAVHPNHLNATVKQITGHTAKKHIQNHLLRLAKSRLLQTEMSIKEIAYSLHFDAPNNFNSFFKKQTGLTPNSFRKSN
ncbi:AraC family transcriptional regulator [Tenacibaculum holothuriorum]|uniref:AraC family transcriptional regulator n=1 Tax=Tenacibaculum holothuriorum TaxID=1635173 RepID=A0A1Y2PES9_9FLAO|nr:helix-turn-helix domain-containing protein [Tenacibaculum holothuriorum]OSY88297.1 AraC family transcriptional regulator [Tenacibaculum holothuriorum]